MPISFAQDQITDESLEVTNLILKIYNDLGFKDVILKYSDRPEKRVGDDKIWDKSEAALLSAIKNLNLNIQLTKEKEPFTDPK